MEKTDWKRNAAILFCVLCGILAVWFVFRRLLAVILPFFLAFLIAQLAKKTVSLMRIRNKKLAKVMSAIVLTAFLLLAFSFFRVLAERLFREAERLTEKLLENRDFLDELLNQSSEYLTEKSGEGISAERIRAFFEYAVREILSAVASELPEWIGKAVSAAPDLLLSALFGVIACYGFCLSDFRKVGWRLPRPLSEKWERCKKICRSVSFRYLKIYGFLFLLTFSELFIGFLILRVEYATLLALLIAFLDILPGIGTGTVLIPWGILSIVGGKQGFGIGILILFLVIEVIRQITEPHLVGKSFGLHPVLTLFAGYAGWKFFGVFGILLAPILLLLLKNLISQFFEIRSNL